MQLQLIRKSCGDEKQVMQTSRCFVGQSWRCVSTPSPPSRATDTVALLYTHRHSGVVTFCVSRRRRKMYCGHARLCVCVSVCVSVCLSAAVRPYYCTGADVTWGHGRGCPLVVHYWADLQSGHGLRCYGNITWTLVTSLHPSRDMTT